MSAIKVVVEMKARPGERERLKSAFEGMLAEQAPNLHGFLGSARYGVPDDPDILVEIAEWESAEARLAHMKEAAAAGTYAPLMALVAEPIRVRVLHPLH